VKSSFALCLSNSERPSLQINFWHLKLFG